MKESLTTLRLLLCIAIASTWVACNQEKKVDQEAEMAKIREMHQLQRDYHFHKDSIAFANQLSDSFISVNRGVVSSPKKDATISRYHGYFSSVDFVKWDDVSDPIIKISDDGTLAYTVVDKIVEVNYRNAEGKDSIGSTHFAWTAIYRKYGDQWKIDCVTSTNKPVE